MNRTILIVICDFLLVSLLAFSTVDINKVAEEGVERRLQVEIVTNNPVEASKDLAAVMRMALDEERRSRELLLTELNQTRESLAQQQSQLTEREKQIASVQQELQAREELSRKLQQDVQAREDQARRLAQEQAALQQQLASAQTNIQSLNQALRSTSVEATVSRERAAAMEAEIKKRAEEAAALQAKLSTLAESNAVVVAEKERLSGRLQVAEVERRHATEQVAKMEEQVRVERQEKAKLAGGVQQLAVESGKLAEEIRENRPLAPNTIFNEFVANRVRARFVATRPGLFGEANKRKDTDSVLVTDGTNTWLLSHVEATPLTIWNPGTDWEALTGTLLGRNIAPVTIRSLSFHHADPRVVFVPVSQAEAKQLGSKAYSLASDPFKFQDSVVIGTSESYYGEVRFQIDVSAPEYVQLDRNFLKGLFGKFNPSRGDLVFSKTGELLGIMVNNSYCLRIRQFRPVATFQFGPDVRAQNTGQILALLHGQLAGMPGKLQ